MSVESTHEEEDETVSRLEHMSDIMISEVCSNPAYAQCLLHIKAYRNYHKEEREEFKERIDVLDERYSRYSSITDAIQILIIVLSAGAAFIQAGNQVFGLPDSSVQFIGLCVSSWTALTLSISKYYKLDEQKEKMNSLRQQCAELMSELGAREDRLNTLCSKEIWAGPPGAPQPPALAAWENERDEMYNNLKTIIQKKQSLVNDFDYLLDSKESKDLIMRAKARTLKYKKDKLSLTKQYTAYEKDKKQVVKDREAVIGKPKKHKLADMASHQPASQYAAMSSVSPGMALKQSRNDNVILGVRENDILRPRPPSPELLKAIRTEVYKPRVGQLLYFNHPGDMPNTETVRVSNMLFDNDKPPRNIVGYNIVEHYNNELLTNHVFFKDEQALFYQPISSYKDVKCDIYFKDEIVTTLFGSGTCKICSYDPRRKTYEVEFIHDEGVKTFMSTNEILPTGPLIDVLVNGHHSDSVMLQLPKIKDWENEKNKTQNSKKNVRFSEENNTTFSVGDRVEHKYPDSSTYHAGTIRHVNEDGTYGISNDYGEFDMRIESRAIRKLGNNDIETGITTIYEDSDESLGSNDSADSKEAEELKDAEDSKQSEEKEDLGKTIVNVKK
jgi:hypothetical protein